MEPLSRTAENTDEAPSVIVTCNVAFGDSEDLLRKEKTKSCGGTINYTLETRRMFVPGLYLMKKLRGDDRIDTIIYHSTVDPDKIRNLLFHCCVGNDFTERNYLNRYDWMHARNWGDKVEERCFFVLEENLGKFSKKKPNSFGLSVDINSRKLEGDWVYGCVLEDISTGKYFALVVEEMYTNSTLSGDEEVPPLLPELKGIARNDLKFDINLLKVDAAHA